MAKKNSKKTTKSENLKIVKNNSAFKRAMKQLDVKPGDKLRVIYDDGSMFIVECP